MNRHLSGPRGKHTCITGPRRLCQILLTTVMTWRAGQAAVQALGQWVGVIVAPGAGELGGMLGT